MQFGIEGTMRADLIKMVQRTMVKGNLTRPLNEPEIRRMCKEPGALSFDRIPVLFPATATRTSVMVLAETAASGLLPKSEDAPSVGKEQTPVARAMQSLPLTETPLTDRQLEILEKTVIAVRNGWLNPEFSVRDIRRAYPLGHHPSYSLVTAVFGSGSIGWAVFFNEARKRLVKEGLLNLEDVGKYIQTKNNGMRWTKSEVVKATVKSMIARGLEPQVTNRQLIAFSREDGNPGPAAITKLFASDDQKNGFGIFQRDVSDAFYAEVEKLNSADDLGIEPLSRELAV